MQYNISILTKSETTTPNGKKSKKIENRWKLLTREQVVVEDKSKESFKATWIWIVFNVCGWAVCLHCMHVRVVMELRLLSSWATECLCVLVQCALCMWHSCIVLVLPLYRTIQSSLAKCQFICCCLNSMRSNRPDGERWMRRQTVWWSSSGREQLCLAGGWQTTR